MALHYNISASKFIKIQMFIYSKTDIMIIPKSLLPYGRVEIWRSTLKIYASIKNPQNIEWVKDKYGDIEQLKIKYCECNQTTEYEHREIER